jgi:hypothetical protein
MAQELIVLEYTNPRTPRRWWVPLGPWWFWPSRRSLAILLLAALAFAWTWHRPLVWDVSLRIPLGVYQSGYWNYSVAFLDHGLKVVGDFDATTVKVWDAQTGAAIRSFAVRDPREGSKWLVSRDEQRILLIGKSTSQLFDLQNGQRLAQYPSPEWRLGEAAPPTIKAGAISPDGSRLLTYHADDELCLWDLTGQVPVKLASRTMSPADTQDPYQPPNLAFSPNGSAVSCVTSAIWMGDGHDLRHRASVTPSTMPWLSSSRFSSDSERFFALHLTNVAGFCRNDMDVYDVTSGRGIGSWPTCATSLAMWDEPSNRLLCGIRPGGIGVATLARAAGSKPIVVAPCPCEGFPVLLFHGGRQAVVIEDCIDYWIPASARVFDLESGRQIATLPDIGYGCWWRTVASEDNNRVASANGSWITIANRVGPDDPWGLIGSPRFITLVALVILAVVSLNADARRRAVGYDAPTHSQRDFSSAPLLVLGTLGVVEAIGWALIGWWWWHIWIRWFFDTVFLAALPCGLGVRLGSRAWRYVAILLCLIMAIVAVMFLTEVNYAWLSRAQFQTFDRNWPPNRGVNWTIVIGLPALVLWALRSLVPPLFRRQ